MTAVGTFHDRVLLLSTAAAIGGTERVIVVLLRELKELGIEARAVFPAESTSEEILRWSDRAGVSVEVHPAVPAIQHSRRWRDVWKLAEFVHQSRAAVVNLHYGVAHISLKDVLAVRLAGAKCVVTVQHAAPHADARTSRNTRLAARLASVVTVGSKAVQSLLAESGVPTSDIRVIPNGVPHPTDPPVPSLLRTSLHLDPQAFVIGSLGRLVPEKGMADLIDAVARLDPGPDGPYLVIAGDGPERAALERAAQRVLGKRAIFLGHIDDPSELYAACQVFALPSYEEGFGLVYVEAAMHGVPSVGTRVGGVPEVVLDGQTGFVVPVGDGPQLVAAIRRIRSNEDLRIALGKSAYEVAQERYSVGGMARSYVRVYNDVTKKQSTWPVWRPAPSEPIDVG